MSLIMPDPDYLNIKVLAAFFNVMPYNTLRIKKEPTHVSPF
ncbi:hypothetical protein PB1E_0505 [Leuconostoc gelidum subsp. gasicomitatum]|nr:hypothetical protein PB1E_0505 [Leuconostoc gasicomitatum]